MEFFVFKHHVNGLLQLPVVTCLSFLPSILLFFLSPSPPLSFLSLPLIHTHISRQLIYNYPEQLFADAGVMAIEHADFEGIERLALVLGNYKLCMSAFVVLVHSIL